MHYNDYRGIEKALVGGAILSVSLGNSLYNIDLTLGPRYDGNASFRIKQPSLTTALFTVDRITGGRSPPNHICTHRSVVEKDIEELVRNNKTLRVTSEIPELLTFRLYDPTNNLVIPHEQIEELIVSSFASGLRGIAETRKTAEHDNVSIS